MRDPNRLNEFYDEMRRIHQEYFPDWRFGQMICNLQRAYGDDLFYIEENEMLTFLKKYVREIDG